MTSSPTRANLVWASAYGAAYAAEVAPHLARRFPDGLAGVSPDDVFRSLIEPSICNHALAIARVAVDSLSLLPEES